VNALVPAVSVRGLSFRYPPLGRQGLAPAVLCGVDLEVQAGEFLAVMGPLGAGKSTLCLALNGLLPQATGGTFGGTVRILGQDTRCTPVSTLARQVGLVFQEPETQLFSSTVEAEVAFGPENLGVDPNEIRERVDWALRVTGLEDLRHRVPAHLSGGQKQRLAIAATLSTSPRLLVLDEPTTALDPRGCREVLSVIAQLSQVQGTTIIMVTQSPEHVLEHADRLALLVKGRILADGAPLDLLTDAELLQEARLQPPRMMALSRLLQSRYGVTSPFATVNQGEAVLRAALDGYHG
jgi:energy-coupling factor transporter ATP-binding protein EcfA2